MEEEGKTLFFHCHVKMSFICVCTSLLQCTYAAELPQLYGDIRE